MAPLAVLGVYPASTEPARPFSHKNRKIELIGGRASLFSPVCLNSSAKLRSFKLNYYLPKLCVHTYISSTDSNISQ
jgi:hypothetical protein